MDSQKAVTSEVSVTAESILETITQDHLKCHICLDTFKDPTLLDCHHTFCRSCLEDLRKSNNLQGFDCPDCRSKTSLTKRGMSGLKPDFTMASLIDGIAEQQKLLNIQQGAVICSLCDNETRAVIHCVDCNERLCQDCWFDLESQHVNHKVDIVDPNSYEPIVVAPKCKKHTEYKYHFFCKTCEVLICLMCAATSHRGMKHEHVDIDEADDSARKELAILLSRSEKRLQNYISEKELVERKRDTMEDAVADAVTTIQHAEAYADSADREHVLQELNEFGQARAAEYSEALDTVCAKIEWIRHTSETISTQVASAGKYELLKLKEELVLTLKYMLERNIRLLELPTLVRMDVKPTSSPKTAGKVQVISSDNTWYMYEDEVDTTIPATHGQRLYWVKVML